MDGRTSRNAVRPFSGRQDSYLQRRLVFIRFVFFHLPAYRFTRTHGAGGFSLARPRLIISSGGARSSAGGKGRRPERNGARLDGGGERVRNRIVGARELRLSGRIDNYQLRFRRRIPVSILVRAPISVFNGFGFWNCPNTPVVYDYDTERTRFTTRNVRFLVPSAVYVGRRYKIVRIMTHTNGGRRIVIIMSVSSVIREQILFYIPKRYRLNVLDNISKSSDARRTDNDTRMIAAKRAISENSGFAFNSKGNVWKKEPLVIY